MKINQALHVFQIFMATNISQTKVTIAVIIPVAKRPEYTYSLGAFQPWAIVVANERQ